MTRIYAFGLHLLFSFLLAVISVPLVFMLWYPSPLDKATGMTAVFLLIICVDVVLGPLMTAVVYKKNKPSLRFDLSCIVIVQLAAFAYGLYVVGQGRPAWIVYNVGRFDLVQASELDYSRLTETDVKYLSPSWLGPGWVGVRVPSDLNARNILTFEAVFAGVDLPQRIDLYTSLDKMKDELSERAMPLGRLHDFNDSELVANVLSASPNADSWLPLMSRNQPMVVLLDRGEGVVIGIVDLRPWD
ncbi:type IV pilin accessory protein [Pseudomonas sp. D1-3]